MVYLQCKKSNLFFSTYECFSFICEIYLLQGSCSQLAAILRSHAIKKKKASVASRINNWSLANKSTKKNVDDVPKFVSEGHCSSLASSREGKQLSNCKLHSLPLFLKLRYKKYVSLKLNKAAALRSGSIVAMRRKCSSGSTCIGSCLHADRHPFGRVTQWWRRHCSGAINQRTPRSVANNFNGFIPTVPPQLN